VPDIKFMGHLQV